MSNEEFLILAKDIIAGYIKEGMPEDEQQTEIPVVPVWLSKALQNNKGVFTTVTPDGRIFEITNDGDYSKLYLNVYSCDEHREIEYVWGEET